MKTIILYLVSKVNSVHNKIFGYCFRLCLHVKESFAMHLHVSFWNDVTKYGGPWNRKCKKLFFGLKFSSIIKTLTFVTVFGRVEFLVIYCVCICVLVCMYRNFLLGITNFNCENTIS